MTYDQFLEDISPISGICRDYLNEVISLGQYVACSRSGDEYGRQIALDVFYITKARHYEDRYSNYAQYAELITDGNRDAVAKLNKLVDQVNQNARDRVDDINVLGDLWDQIVGVIG